MGKFASVFSFIHSSPVPCLALADSGRRLKGRV